MNTCKTCRWWVTPDEGSRAGIVMREIGEAFDLFGPHAEWDTEPPHEIAAQTVRRCASPKLLFYEVPEKSGAAVCDGSQYWGCLATGEDFGCVNHEAQP